ncbi:hypothetical protein [Candidatus Palauibacter soopunensis]|uniref:hypothetical protein n=1 Tax=Candidatus Palauibacter soopunensis TaxID=3056739 RepID=UPI00238F58E6|nr:hypothetical protein [Candidatus Palauibacter soopunensis]MDE2879649.1 hypothetical protein [Candidatus Palauibacter soopunensis]MDE2982018.1 hypothetical protein [Gemmatimonadota bacterium]
MNEFDQGVILRAHRFRAESVGYRLERGHYMEGEDDRADRWYVVPASRRVSTAADRSGPGFRSIKAAADDAKRVLVEFADGSPFGAADVRLLLRCRALRAGRAIQSLVNAGLARPTDRGGRHLYGISPRGRDLAATVIKLRSRAKEDRKALDTRGKGHGRRR